jgi:general secretion pathway protein I
MRHATMLPSAWRERNVEDVRLPPPCGEDRGRGIRRRFTWPDKALSNRVEISRASVESRCLGRYRFSDHSRALAKPVAPEARTGFTLLEIILSLAILAGSLAALGEVMRLADQNATSTRDETQAQILASSVMDELIAGVIPLGAVNQSPAAVESDPPWVFSIAVEQTGYTELIGVRVLVEQQAEPRLQPARFELVRWLPNPDYVPPATPSQSSTGSSSQSSTGASSGASTGANSGQTGGGGQR